MHILRVARSLVATLGNKMLPGCGERRAGERRASSFANHGRIHEIRTESAQHAGQWIEAVQACIEETVANQEGITEESCGGASPAVGTRTPTFFEPMTPPSADGTATESPKSAGRNKMNDFFRTLNTGGVQKASSSLLSAARRADNHLQMATSMFSSARAAIEDAVTKKDPSAVGQGGYFVIGGATARPHAVPSNRDEAKEMTASREVDAAAAIEGTAETAPDRDEAANTAEGSREADKVTAAQAASAESAAGAREVAAAEEAAPLQEMSPPLHVKVKPSVGKSAVVEDYGYGSGKHGSLMLKHSHWRGWQPMQCVLHAGPDARLDVYAGAIRWEKIEKELDLGGSSLARIDCDEHAGQFWVCDGAGGGISLRTTSDESYAMWREAFTHTAAHMATFTAARTPKKDPGADAAVAESQGEDAAPPSPAARERGKYSVSILGVRMESGWTSGSASDGLVFIVRGESPGGEAQTKNRRDDELYSLQQHLAMALPPEKVPCLAERKDLNAEDPSYLNERQVAVGIFLEQVLELTLQIQLEHVTRVKRNDLHLTWVAACDFMGLDPWTELSIDQP
ncbi:hypothetical protein CYMTET_6122 [Cymbomonas tetramitiformis]|uniref:PH domain-containing protein n=1 Tax=Cymbomonas tetramitiformis TaxID=36881 RepID=A0AAE0GXS1_9CHLO|nr:hypothetical protein CYMTET_6122 [Cymbomonas tetramitiformis]